MKLKRYLKIILLGGIFSYSINKTLRKRKTYRQSYLSYYYYMVDYDDDTCAKYLDKDDMIKGQN